MKNRFELIDAIIEELDNLNYGQIEEIYKKMVIIPYGVRLINREVNE